jgi:uncharacterized protein with GYD domain
MPAYIALCRWTQKGVENAKDSPARLDAARKAFKAAGGELKEFYLTLGQYDFVTISEFPDDATAAKAVLLLAKAGNVRTETLKAFSEDEYRRITGSLG